MLGAVEKGAAARSRLSLRRLAPIDASAYLAFRVQALAATPTAFTSTADEERHRPIAWALSRIRSDSRPDDFVLGAFSSERLVGVAGFSVPEQLQARHKGLLFGMAVAREAAGHGVGRRLVERLLTEARGIAGMLQVVLTVSEGNVPAERLYRSCGFREFGREPRAVIVNGESVTKIHMVKMLDRDWAMHAGRP